MKIQVLLSSVCAVLALSIAASPAQAAPSPVTPSIKAEISALVKGGAEQIGPHTVQWNDGAVVYDLAPELDRVAVAPTATVHGCPAGYFCFYDAQNYGGRRVQYRDCFEQALPTDFTNRVTSWVHNKSTGRVVPYEIGGDELWVEYPNSQSSNVGPAANDAMYGFNCYL